METKPPAPRAILVGIQVPSVDDTRREHRGAEAIRPAAPRGRYAASAWPAAGRRAALYFKLHTSTTFGKGAPGSSQTTMVELEVVAVPPLGRRIPGEELGLDEED
jgi:hypothetical protein